MPATASSPLAAAAPPRPLPAVIERLLIIGLDGATFDVLNPMMAEGRMPRLRAAVESGASGTLYSTVPPITPAAWTTFLCGKQPGRHGVLDFEWYDVDTGRLQLNSTRRVSHVRNLWQILSEKGLRVGSVNVPMTYPPTPVNGFMVSGFDAPGPKSDFVYPRELREEILARWPDPTLKSKWRSRVVGAEEQFARNLQYVSRSFHQGAEMTQHLGDRFGWDVLMVVFKLVDNLQHKTWKYLDPRWVGRDTRRRELVKGCFAELDAAVGRLLDYAEANGAAVMMVSDHGHGSLDGKVYPNRLLHEWGYLALKPAPDQWAARARKVFDRFRDRRKRWAPKHDIERHVPIDLTRTRACVMHAGLAGFLYINLKGRQPTGIVEPADYERLREEIRARLLSDDCVVRDPSGQAVRLFPEVHKPEELYGVSRENEPWMPDLLLISHPGLSVVRRLRGRKVVEWLGYRRMEGTHRKEGILIAAGPGVSARRAISATLADCTPTVLAALGFRVPGDMEGRVVSELFRTAPRVEHERMEAVGVPVSRGEIAAGAAATASNGVYSERELEQITERLSDLGYLE